jgi:hypothetical protein
VLDLLGKTDDILLRLEKQNQIEINILNKLEKKSEKKGQK